MALGSHFWDYSLGIPFTRTTPNLRVIISSYTISTFGVLSELTEPWARTDVRTDRAVSKDRCQNWPSCEQGQMSELTELWARTDVRTDRAVSKDRCQNWPKKQQGHQWQRWSNLELVQLPNQTPALGWEAGPGLRPRHKEEHWDTVCVQVPQLVPALIQEVLLMRRMSRWFSPLLVECVYHGLVGFECSTWIITSIATAMGHRKIHETFYLV